MKDYAMFKKILLAFAMLYLLIGSAFAAVDINTADQAALDSVKGIGAVKSKAILDERTKGGPFKDWADFEKRVKGFAAKSTDALSKNGVTVNGQAKVAAAAAAASTSTSTSASAKAAPASASASAAPAPAASASAKASASAAPASKAASAPAASAASVAPPKK
jgi:competence protein ComEA